LQIYRFGDPIRSVGFLKVLSSNSITWFNLDLPPEAKKSILKELQHIMVESVQIESAEKQEKPTLTITLMTSPSCSLCTVAKAVIAGVSAQVGKMVLFLSSLGTGCYSSERSEYLGT
jgi:hypothetical protein